MCFKASLNLSFSEIPYCLKSRWSHLFNKQVLTPTPNKPLRTPCLRTVKCFFISVCRNACSEITYSINLTPSRREPQLKKDKDGAIEQLKCVYHRVCKLQPGFFAQRRPLRSLIQSPFTLILDPILTSLTLPFPRQQKIRGSKQEGKVLLEAGTPMTMRMSFNRKC